LIRHCLVCGHEIERGNLVLSKYKLRKICSETCKKELYRQAVKGKPRAKGRCVAEGATRTCKICGKPIYRSPKYSDSRYHSLKTCGRRECTNAASQVREATGSTPKIWNELDSQPDTVSWGKLLEGCCYVVCEETNKHDALIQSYRNMLNYGY